MSEGEKVNGHDRTEDKAKDKLAECMEQLESLAVAIREYMEDDVRPAGKLTLEELLRLENLLEHLRDADQFLMLYDPTKLPF